MQCQKGDLFLRLRIKVAPEIFAGSFHCLRPPETGKSWMICNMKKNLKLFQKADQGER